MERRLAAILAADVVGYSRLIREDEAGTLAALKTHREQLIEPKVAERKGRIVKLMGDGLLVEFPSAVEAVQCAVEIQHLIGERNADVAEERRITYRIGINIGDIVVEDDDIYGDGVNVAARLEGLAEPSGICVARNVFDQVKDKLDLTIDHLGEREVKNIAEPVTVCRVVLDEKAAALVTPVVRKTTMPVHRRWMVAAAAALVAAIGGVFWWQPWAPNVEPASVEKIALPLPDKPSIAVLPFRTIGTGEEAAYFSNGLTNDLITDLSRFGELFVSASNSVFAYQGKAVSTADVGRELGVRYILQGSVQQAASNIRVNAELVDSTTDKNIWARRYDRNLSDLFVVQDEIVKEIIVALNLRITEAELQRTKLLRPGNMQAYDYVLRGRNLLSQVTRAANHNGRGLLQTAIELDPDYALAYTELGRAMLRGSLNGWEENPRETIKRAHDLARAAIDIESHAEGHALLGLVYLQMKHFDLARAELDRAIEMNPNDANGYAALGAVSLWTSEIDRAVEAFETSIRLDPRSHPYVLTRLAAALYLQKKYDSALSLLERSAATKSDELLTQMFLAATYMKLDRPQDASTAAEKVRELHPFFSVEPYRNVFANPAHGADLADTLIAIGLE
jgi:adenylate cyclase